MTSTPTPVIPEEQLLELLIQLQKTTPEQARAILNAQPAIGYALVPLMAKMGILNLDILQVRYVVLVDASFDFTLFGFVSVSLLCSAMFSLVSYLNNG